MYNLLVLVGSGSGARLVDAIGRSGLSCSVESGGSLSWEYEDADVPDAVLLDLESVAKEDARREVSVCREKKIPVLAALPLQDIESYDPSLNPDEILICPAPDGEAALRVKQALYRVRGPANSSTLTVGELSIDTERYEVQVAGRRVTLTYKEFQLLALLASNPGRVYSREVLLSQVWGYDYLGGTRTVDVHVRRLRSKVESPGRSFIETIWNVGYRFTAPS